MLDRSIAPPFQKTTQFELIEPLYVGLTNGIDMYVVPGGEQEVIKIEVIIKAGRWHEKAWGAAHFTGNLLLKGTRTKSSFEIARIFDFYGAHVEISPGLDVISVSLYALSKNLTPVLDLFVEVLSESIFPEKELEQSKTIYLQNLRVNKEKTSFQASKLFRHLLFGGSHPYGRELDEKEVALLSQPALVEHHSSFFSDFFVIASGNINDSTVDQLSQKFSAFTRNSSIQPLVSPPADNPARHTHEKEGSIQTSVRVGRRFIGRNHTDYFDVLLLSHILGGYFGSRLMKNIREEKGLTYGIYASIHTLIRDNYLVMGADVNKENVELTFDEIRKELRKLRLEPVPADELETAKNHFIGSLQAEITTPFSHADKVKNIIIYGLSKDYYNRLISRIDALTTEDLIRVGGEYFNEDGFYEIAVG